MKSSNVLMILAQVQEIWGGPYSPLMMDIADRVVAREAEEDLEGNTILTPKQTSDLRTCIASLVNELERRGADVSGPMAQFAAAIATEAVLDFLTAFNKRKRGEGEVDMRSVEQVFIDAVSPLM